MRLFFANTARAGELEEFRPLDPPRVGLYTCGQPSGAAPPDGG
jgi:hypothetical protein